MEGKFFSRFFSEQSYAGRVLRFPREKLQGLRDDNWQVPVALSLILHGILTVGFIVVMPEAEERRINPTPNFVTAKVVTLEPKAKPQPVRKATPKPKRQIKAKPVVKPVVKPKPQPDKAAIALKRKQEQERKNERDKKKEKERLAQLERERLELLQKQQEQEMLASLNRERQAQQQAVQEKTDRATVDGYAGVIKALVQSQWSRPASAKRGMKATFRIRMLPTGEVISIAMISGSGDSAFDRSALQAIEKAQPFREVQGLESRLFERNLREYKFVFDPRDLLK